MTRRRRRLLLIIGTPAYALVLAILSWVLAVIIVDPIEGWGVIVNEVAQVVFQGDFSDVAESFTQGFVWAYFLGPAVLVTVTQALFLLPVLSPPRIGTTRGRSLMLSFVIAGLVGAGLATGLFLALAQLIRMIAGLDEDFVAESPGMWIVWLMLPLTLSWILWTVLIRSFARRNQNPHALLRLIRILLAATFVEVLVVLPLDIMVRRRSNCYCGTGTAHTLGFAAWAGLWLAGPGIIFAVLSKRRRLWSETNCINCGYAKGPSPGANCPECGFGWDLTRAKPQAADG